jgi:hypothetical protein
MAKRRNGKPQRTSGTPLTEPSPAVVENEATTLPGKSRILQFEFKLGWSELLAFAALIVSAISLIQVAETSRPQVVVETLTPVAGPIVQDGVSSADTVFVAAIPLLVTNRGGRDVALVGIRPDEIFPWISAARGDSVDRDPELSYRVFFTRGTPVTLDVPRRGLDSVDYKTARDMELVSIPVESGHSALFTFGIYVESYRDARQLADYFLVAANLKFSDGTTHPIRHGIGTVPQPQ